MTLLVGTLGRAAHAVRVPETDSGEIARLYRTARHVQRRAVCGRTVTASLIPWETALEKCETCARRLAERPPTADTELQDAIDAISVERCPCGHPLGTAWTTILAEGRQVRVHFGCETVIR